MNRNYLNMLHYWTKKRIPYVFDETLSLYQIVRLTIQSLNEMIKDQNELKDAILEFFEAFEKDLSVTIIDVLEKWKQEGYLEEIINEALFNQKADKDYVDDEVNNIRGTLNDEILTLTTLLNKEIKDVNDLTILLIENLKTDLTNKNDDPNIMVREGIIRDTKVHYFIIPRVNKDGTHNTLKLGYYQGGRTIENFLGTEKLYVSNAGMFNMENMTPRGTIMIDGQVLFHGEHQDDSLNRYRNVAWNNEGFKSYVSFTDPQTIKDEGYNWVVGGGYTMIEEGVRVRQGTNEERAQRTILGQLKTGELIVGVVGGRMNIESGVTVEEIGDYFENNYSIEYLHLLDGGGSTQGLFYDNLIIPPNKDGFSGLTSYREVPTFIYIDKKEKDFEQNNARNIKHEKILNDLRNKVYFKNEFIPTKELSEMVANDMAYISGSDPQTPGGNGYAVTMQTAGTNKYQIFFSAQHPYFIAVRMTSAGSSTYADWWKSPNFERVS